MQIRLHALGQVTVHTKVYIRTHRPPRCSSLPTVPAAEERAIASLKTEQSMRTRVPAFSHVAPLAVMLALGVGLPLKAAAAYTYTLIADSSGPFSFVGYEPPSINAGGTVAFRSLLDAAGVDLLGSQGIFTGNGAIPNVTTTIADSSGPFRIFSGPTINTGGTVAFRATLDAGGQGIYTGTGAVPNVTRTIADTSGLFRRVSVSPSINDAGTVAFLANFTGGSGVFTGTGAVPNVIATIADSNGPFSSFGESTVMNNGGTVAFLAQLDSGARGVFTGNGAVPNVTTTIADSGGPLDAFGPSPAINAGGTVLFDANFDAGGQGLFTGTGAVPNVVTPIADTQGPFSPFGSLYSINTLGTVAFFAALDTGIDGIFTGPDPVADKVIQSGDSLFGGTVVFLDVGNLGLNDAGQIAFFFELADGTRGIALANPVPVPEAGTLALLSIGLGGLALAVRREGRDLKPSRPRSTRRAAIGGGARARCECPTAASQVESIGRPGVPGPAPTTRPSSSEGSG